MAPTVDDCKALHDKYQWYLAGDFFTAWSEDDLQAFIKEEVGKLNIRAPLRPMYVELLGETFRRELERLDVMYQAFKEEQMWLMVTDAAAAYVGSPEAPVISHIPEHSQLHGEEVDWVVV